MKEFLASYSLNVYPYELDALDPLVVSEHEELLAGVSGMAKQDQIDAELAAAAGRDGPVFVLVTGKDYCGLTSVANYCLARYARHRKIDLTSGRFVVPNERKVVNDSVVDFWYNWVAELVDKLDKGKFVKQEILDDLEERARTVTADKIGATLLRPVRRLADELAALDPQANFGVCIENPGRAEFVQSAFQAFSSARVICVFVVGDYADGRDKAIRHFDENQSPAPKLKVRMEAIGGAEVAALVRKRWARLAKEVPLPFEENALEAAFESARPIKRIMKLMQQLLEYKASIEHPGKVWPKDKELWFDAADLRRRIEIHDKDLWFDAAQRRI